jgi:hypothetical protein
MQVRAAALIEPLCNVCDISEKVLALAFSDTLIGAADVRLKRRPQLIAIDTVVHNFLHWT